MDKPDLVLMIDEINVDIAILEQKIKVRKTFLEMLEKQLQELCIPLQQVGLAHCSPDINRLVNTNFYAEDYLAEFKR